MSEIISATRYALTGIVVGSLVSAGGDLVFDYAMGSMGPVPATTTPGAATGRGLFGLVVGSATIAGSLLVGDKILSVLNTGIEDPLFRAVYYTTSIATSRTVIQASSLTRGVVMNLSPMMRGPSSVSVAPTPGTATTSCGKNCGQ